VLIGAEADPDFEFPGLAELIRNFDAEIKFLDETEAMARAKSDAFTSLEPIDGSTRARMRRSRR